MFIIRYVVTVLIACSLFGCIEIRELEAPSTVEVGDEIEIKATLVTDDEYDGSRGDYVKPYVVLGIPADWKPISVIVTYGPVKPELIMTTYVPEDLAIGTPEGYRWYVYKAKEYYLAADYLDTTFEVIVNAEIGEQTGKYHPAFRAGLVWLGNERIEGGGMHGFSVEVVDN